MAVVAAVVAAEVVATVVAVATVVVVGMATGKAVDTVEKKGLTAGKLLVIMGRLLVKAKRAVTDAEAAAKGKMKEEVIKIISN